MGGGWWVVGCGAVLAGQTLEPVVPNFFYHPRMLAYDFGPQHPLRPERLRRAVELLKRLTGVEPIDPGEGDPADVLRVHDPEFVDVVREISNPEDRSARADARTLPSEVARFGFSFGDTPPFRGMFEASLAYVAGSVEAAKRVREGASLAFNLSGGLHHARRAEASGFCVFNDAAVAIDVLLERFERVAYVDIDVHHGDGVQWIWYEDPRVLTCSIHESGRYLYPGTGFVEETGASFTSVNVPLAPNTTGDAWLWAFEEGVLPALRQFEPKAIVLQMGTDVHFTDPLAHLRVAAQDWLSAVRCIRDLGVPIVAVGGGGYALKAVPRMWAAACMTLAGIEYADALPQDLAEAWEMPTFHDPFPPGPAGSGRAEAERAVAALREKVHPNVPMPN